MRIDTSILTCRQSMPPLFNICPGITEQSAIKCYHIYIPFYITSYLADIIFIFACKQTHRKANGLAVKLVVTAMNDKANKAFVTDIKSTQGELLFQSETKN